MILPKKEPLGFVDYTLEMKRKEWVRDEAKVFSLRKWWCNREGKKGVSFRKENCAFKFRRFELQEGKDSNLEMVRKKVQLEFWSKEKDLPGIFLSTNVNI